MSASAFEGIAHIESLQLGGVSQRIWIHGRSLKNPFVILLHGGPGASQTALFRHYNRALESQFTMVYWDQRGTGRSYSSKISESEMTVERMDADLSELIAWLKQRYGIQKVLLLGHSWGSVLGILYAAHHADDVLAYVGVGQVANMDEGERVSYEFALERARDAKNSKAEKALLKIGPPPHSPAALMISRHWCEKFGGVFAGAMNQNSLVWAALKEKGTGIKDLWYFRQGLNFSLRTMWPQVRTLDLTTFDDFKVPIFFVLGRMDRAVPAVLAERYFSRIQAPIKKLFWLENSGHYGHFEESLAFQSILTREVLSCLDRT
jgi:pimeloyl-ACP methyl ester carboxylesterase